LLWFWGRFKYAPKAVGTVLPHREDAGVYSYVNLLFMNTIPNVLGEIIIALCVLVAVVNAMPIRWSRTKTTEYEYNEC
jgi:hypothetical protein